MRYLVIITLTVLFAGCFTINKTYLPQAKKDTVYLPCNQIHLQKTPSRQWPNWEYPLHTPGIVDTSIYWRGGSGTVKIDTLPLSSSGRNSIYTISDTLETINGTIRVWGKDSVYILNGNSIFSGGGGGYSVTDTTHKPLKHKKEVKPKCEHRYTSTTLMGCEGAPCNTCKCLSCGYTWSCW